MNNITIEECLEKFMKEGAVVILNDGRVLGFDIEEE